MRSAAAELHTENAAKGLHTVNRLPVGVAAAPAIFQRFMEMTLSGALGVFFYLDYIIVTGSSEEEHRDRVAIVLQ